MPRMSSTHSSRRGGRSATTTKEARGTRRGIRVDTRPIRVIICGRTRRVRTSHLLFLQYVYKSHNVCLSVNMYARSPPRIQIQCASRHRSVGVYDSMLENQTWYTDNVYRDKCAIRTVVPRSRGVVIAGIILDIAEVAHVLRHEIELHDGCACRYHSRHCMCIPSGATKRTVK